MNIDAQKLTQILTNGGASAGHAEAKAAGANGLEQPGARPLQSEPRNRRQRRRGAAAPARFRRASNQVGYEYILRPVLLVVPRGSPDSAFDARKKEAEALRGRFSDCTSGIPFARALREVAVRDPVSKSSADFSEELRDILDKTDLGHLTPPEQTNEGIQMFAVCAKKETKNDSPGMQKMRDQLFEAEIRRQGQALSGGFAARRR